MIGMLVADNHPFAAVALRGRYVGQTAGLKQVDPVEPHFGPEVLDWRHRSGLVQRPGGDLDRVAVEVAERERACRNSGKNAVLPPRSC